MAFNSQVTLLPTHHVRWFHFTTRTPGEYLYCIHYSTNMCMPTNLHYHETIFYETHAKDT